MNGAKKMFELGEAISQTDESYSTILNKGNALDSLDRKEEAIEAFDEAIKLDPNCSATYICKGNTLSDLYRNEEAIRAYDEAIRLNPGDSDAYYNKGVILSLDRKEEAIRAYDEAIKCSPDNALYYCTKGQALNALNREHHALVCYNKAHKLSKTGKREQNASEYIEKYINTIITEERRYLLNKVDRLHALTRVY